MRKNDKELREYKEQWQSLTYMIESGVPGTYEELRNALETEATGKGYTLAQIRGKKDTDDVVRYNQHYLHGYIKNLTKEVEENDQTWITHPKFTKFRINTTLNLIKQFDDGNYYNYNDNTIYGIKRLEFIMEALEANEKKIEYPIPSCGYGAIEHIVPPEHFKGNLYKRLYDSPMNLKRVPSEEMIVAMRTRGLRVEIRYYNSYIDLHQVPELQKYSVAYLRQAVRRDRVVAGWALGRSGFRQKTFKDLEKKAKENKLNMYELGWLKAEILDMDEY